MERWLSSSRYRQNHASATDSPAHLPRTRTREASTRWPWTDADPAAARRPAPTPQEAMVGTAEHCLRRWAWRLSSQNWQRIGAGSSTTVLLPKVFGQRHSQTRPLLLLPLDSARQPQTVSILVGTYARASGERAGGMGRRWRSSPSLACSTSFSRSCRTRCLSRRSVADRRRVGSAGLRHLPRCGGPYATG
jgi:hypothetical protein